MYLIVAEPPQFEDGSFLFKVYDRNKQVHQRVFQQNEKRPLCLVQF